MNDYLLSLIQGVIEGLTEFLPVSSTAHLRVSEMLLGINSHDKFWEMYAVVIQLGAIMAVVVYFWKRLAVFVTSFPKGPHGDRKWFNHPLTLVMIAFVVTAGPAYLLTKMISDNLDNAFVMGWALIIGGVVMAAVDLAFRKPRITRLEQMGVVEAIWIGAVQITSAVFPGTSRSMSTIAAGQVFGMSREAALEFSFFLSIPTMVAATLWKLKTYVRPPVNKLTGIRPDAVHITGQQWAVLGIGTLVSFLVAWVVIAFFMHWVRKHGFVPFAVYRLVAGGAVLWMAYRGMLN